MSAACGFCCISDSGLKGRWEAALTIALLILELNHNDGRSSGGEIVVCQENDAILGGIEAGVAVIEGHKSAVPAAGSECSGCIACESSCGQNAGNRSGVELVDVAQAGLNRTCGAIEDGIETIAGAIICHCVKSIGPG